MWDGVIVGIILLLAAAYLFRRWRRQAKAPRSVCDSCPQSCSCDKNSCDERRFS